MTQDDTDIDELVNRIESLEKENSELKETVADLQEATSQQQNFVRRVAERFADMDVGRRRVLQTGTTLGLGAILGGTAVGSAAAVQGDWSNATGSTSSQSEPLAEQYIRDLYTQTARAETLNADEINNGGSPVSVTDVLKSENLLEITFDADGYTEIEAPGGNGGRALVRRFNDSSQAPGGFQFEDANGNVVTLQAEGGELVVFDSNGTKTTLS